MRVALTGCLYGVGNIGDEAILAGILEIVPGHINLGVCAGDNHERFRKLGLEVFGSSAEEIRRAVQWADYVFLGGASLLTDPMGPDYPIAYTCSAIRQARLRGKRCRFIGIGAAQLKSERSLDVARRHYPQAELFTVRNQQSADALRSQLYIPAERIHVMCDPAFLLGKRVSADRGKTLLKEHGVTLKVHRPNIAVSVVNEGFEQNRDYHRKIAEVCDQLSLKLNANIVFVYSEIRREQMYDLAAAERVKGYMNASWRELPPRFYDAAEFASMLGAFDAVLAMRMHVIIMASLSGVPTAAIVREDKVRQILDELGLSEAGSIDDIDVQKVVKQISYWISKQELTRAKLLERVEAIATRGKLVARNVMFRDLQQSRSWSPRYLARELSAKLRNRVMNSFLYPLNSQIKRVLRRPMWHNLH